jgi:hypothetical protein
MKKLSMVLGLVLSISSVSNAFCLKQYSNQMNRYTASFPEKAKKNNFAAVEAAGGRSTTTLDQTTYGTK